MSQENLNKSIAENFPDYNPEEREILSHLLKQDKESNEFKQAKEKFLELLYEDLVEFYKWDAMPDKRSQIRRRLISVSSLFVVMPIEDLRDISHKAKLTLKKIVYDAPPDPLKYEVAEMHSYDLKFFEGFKKVLHQIQIEENKSALDYVAGNREKRIYPATQFTVFRKNLQEEVISKQYLTASAEPLTQTILVSLYNPDGSVRDLVTIGFDLVFESAFIDFFHHAPQISPLTLLRNSHLVGKQFLLETLETFHRYRKDQQDDYLNLLPFFNLSQDEVTKKQVDELMVFINNSLLAQINEKIVQWNQQLGLEKTDNSIFWDVKK